MKSMTSMRELRKWHWRQAMALRLEQRDLEEGCRLAGFDRSGELDVHRRVLARAAELGTRADLHISAVQVLNDAFPDEAWTTAEQDCAEEDAERALARQADSEGGDHD